MGGGGGRWSVSAIRHGACSVVPSLLTAKLQQRPSLSLLFDVANLLTAELSLSLSLCLCLCLSVSPLDVANLLKAEHSLSLSVCLSVCLSPL